MPVQDMGIREIAEYRDLAFAKEGFGQKMINRLTDDHERDKIENREEIYKELVYMFMYGEALFCG
ncbi:hypothetical protein GFL09_22220 [Pseudomonas stutzeri]|uniref:hypothetical protein n=1 Tax=Stutzerimonas stutzeri TaxID=316 RepID=UPI00190DE05B|nr:hypothetical protein [Stutzerimonas stutzeri]MBK3870364.1 hypothetical protein [Stutzerimonas stutzeri]